jgi:hypothetical protein
LRSDLRFMLLLPFNYLAVKSWKKNWPLMKKFTHLLIFLCAFSCMNRTEVSNQNPMLIYKADNFEIHRNKVIQCNFQAEALSATELKSNYQSPANQTFNRTVQFKFSINGKDNEQAPGRDHLVTLKAEAGKLQVSEIKFGKLMIDTFPVKTGDYLPPNTPWKIRLDMREVFASFEKYGSFTFYNGDVIYKQDFKGVYIAGGSEPLMWDFENLPGRKDLELKDPDGDGIYEIDLVMNVYDEANFTASEWKLKRDISKYPSLESDILLVDALHNLSLEEMLLDIRPDSTFMAGEKWNGVWTRDISYSILLSLAILEPEVATNSLMRKVARGKIIQDTGTGGSWPCSSDRMTWALAANEIYLVTGDKKWLRQAFDIIRNSAEDDLQTIYDPNTGLMKAESSFMDWREQTYARWMDPVDIYNSLNLGTNAVHYQTYRILESMGRELNEPVQKYTEIAEGIKKGINQHLWMQDKKFYGQHLYGKRYPVLSPRSDALGESLVVLTGIADDKRSREVVSNVPVMDFGIPTIYPDIPGIPPYHNRSNWPFVQAYWNLASAKAGNTASVEHGLAAMYRVAGLFLTNKENLDISNGDFKGTAINSNRQLWSVAGNLAMVYKLFFGMKFEADKLSFTTFVPDSYKGEKSLKNFRYRNAVLNISLTGSGNKIKSFELDGKTLSKAEIPGELEGSHEIRIVLEDNKIQSPGINKLKSYTSPETPVLIIKNNILEWEPVPGAVEYYVYLNGKKDKTVTSSGVAVPKSAGYQEYTVAAVDKKGVTSFLAEPVQVFPAAKIFQFEEFTRLSSLPYKGFTGKGFVELTRDKNRMLNFEVSVPKEGKYWIDFRYSNGSGPVNTDNKCAIRSLYLGDDLAGVVVMPQRGSDEWSNWGYSNALLLDLKKGKNRFKLTFEPFNENMNIDVNTAMVDHVRVVSN